MMPYDATSEEERHRRLHGAKFMEFKQHTEEQLQQKARKEMTQEEIDAAEEAEVEDIMTRYKNYGSRLLQWRGEDKGKKRAEAVQTLQMHKQNQDNDDK